MPAPFTVAMIATYRHAALLRQALVSLRRTEGLGAGTGRLVAVVVDNADDPETAAVVDEINGGGGETNALEVIRLTPGQNLGCGGGLAHGEAFALARFPQATHFWILDDDAEVFPATLPRLLAALAAENAVAATPMVEDPDGKIDWFPGLLDPAAFRVIKTRGLLPADYLRACGPGLVPFSWATGVSFLATRAALETLGLHRADYWIRGEDLEFSLRLTHRHRGVFVPEARVIHWSFSDPARCPTPQALEAECRKTAAMIRNIASMMLRLPHTRRIVAKLPGNLWRFLKNFGPLRFRHALAALWWGGVMNRPAGVEPLMFPQSAPAVPPKSAKP